MELKVGDKVSVLDTEGIWIVGVGDVGIVQEITTSGLTEVYFSKYKLVQYFDSYQLQPVSEVIKVDCHKPNVLQRIWNYLRGIK